VPELLRAGHTVRAMARDPGKLAEVPWRGDAETMAADLIDPVPSRSPSPGRRSSITWCTRCTTGTSCGWTALHHIAHSRLPD
jgi:hypothetical protein